MENNKETSIIRKRMINTEVLDKDKQPLLLLGIIAPFLGFLFYASLWMFFCVLLVAVIQIVVFVFVIEPQKIKIDVNCFEEYVNKEKTLRRNIAISYSIMAVLDTFPFWSMSETLMRDIRGIEPYEGGVIVSVMTVAMVSLCFVGAYLHTDKEKTGILSDYDEFKETGKTKEELESEERRMKVQELRIIEENNIKKYGVDYISLGCNLFINDKTSMFYIEDVRGTFVKGIKEYKFEDILKYEVFDNYTTTTQTSGTTTETKTSSMVGRAVAGGVLLGGVGAVIGGVTAPKTTSETVTQSSVIHDYSVVITVNNIKSPCENIHIGNDEAVLNKIVSTLTVILNKNKPQ